MTPGKRQSGVDMLRKAADSVVPGVDLEVLSSYPVGTEGSRET